MRSAGIDLGSRSIELVLLEDGRPLAYRQTETGFDPLKQARNLLAGLDYDHLLATGYGRHLFAAGAGLAENTVTEIKAVAAGCRALLPGADLILDIGGQDAKVIALKPDGRVSRFEMNDRCAAGTGKFLEIAAMSLGFALEDFGAEALLAEKELEINSMCAVFAESEITSLISRGENRRDIALGLHRAIVKRSVAMIKRFAGGGRLAFVGGVAANPCIRRLLAEQLQIGLLVPEQPQMVAAHGAALLAAGPKF